MGFTLAGRVFHLGADGDWKLWKAALLGGLLMIPFAVGAALGVRAVRGGWVGLVANTVLGRWRSACRWRSRSPG